MNTNKIKLTIRIDPLDYEEAKEYCEEITHQTLNKYINKAIKNYNKYLRKIYDNQNKMKEPEYLRTLANIIERENNKKDPMKEIEDKIINDLHKTNNN